MEEEKLRRKRIWKLAVWTTSSFIGLIFLGLISCFMAAPFPTWTIVLRGAAVVACACYIVCGIKLLNLLGAETCYRNY